MRSLNFIYSILLLFVCISCGGSGQENTEPTSIIGHWTSECASSKDISFPNWGAFFTIYGVMEMQIDGDRIASKLRSYTDSHCTTEADEYEMFHGTYEIKEEIKLENGDVINRLSISGEIVSSFMNIDTDIYYFIEDDLLYFSGFGTEEPTIDYGYYYVKESSL